MHSKEYSCFFGVLAHYEGKILASVIKLAFAYPMMLLHDEVFEALSMF